MAKGISFKVTAKDEASGTINKVAGNINSFSKETKDALQPLNNLNKSFNNVVSALAPVGIAVTAAVATVNKLSAAVSECTDKWAANELAIKRINFAGTVNKELSNSTTTLKNFAQAISEASNGWHQFGDVADAMTTLLYDKTEPQIKAIISAASDLSIAMGTDLNTAVTQLNNTFAGNVGQLGKMFPELKNLTAEELAAGDAIDIVAEKVKGASEAFANSTDGIRKAAQDAKDSLKSALGDLFADMVNPMTSYFTQLTRHLADMLNKVTKLRDAERALANSNDLETRYNASQIIAENTENEIKKYRIKFGEGNIEDDIWYKALMAEYEQERSVFNQLGLQLSQARQDAYAAKEAALATINTTTGTAAPTETPTGTGTASGGVSGWLPIYNVRGSLGTAINPFTGSSGNFTPSWDKSSAITDYSQYDRNASIIAGMQPDNIAGVLDSFIGSIGGVVSQFASLQMIMNPVNTIMTAFAETISPVVDATLAPLVGILTTLGQTLGKVLAPAVQILTPAVELVARAFTWLYNTVLLPIGNSFIGLFNMLYNAVAGLANGFIGIYNAIAWIAGGSRASYLSYKSLTDGQLTAIDTSTLGANGASAIGSYSAGASYTAARDITVNITYSNSYVNGDAEQIAISLKKELKRIEALGY